MAYGPQYCDIFMSSKANILLYKFILLNQSLIKKGFKVERLKKRKLSLIKCGKNAKGSNSVSYMCLGISILVVLISFIVNLPYLDGMMKQALGIKCVLPNNYLVWEATRPVADCNICKGVNSVLILPNITREEFLNYAYSYRPIIIKNAAKHWPALEVFNYWYFRDLFESTPGSYESIDEECQFLNFKTDLYSLKQVFTMSRSRVTNMPGEKPWYIGWSNCHSSILSEMRKYYSKPHFLPVDAEHSHVDYIFMGYQQGAFMHLDYISRLMWQAQLRGTKQWRLNPPPECEAVCQSFTFTVHPSDILLLDTRQWYHDTHVLNNEFSLTVSSEYG